MAAKKLDDAEPFVGTDGRPQVMDDVDAAGDGRRKANAVISAKDIIVRAASFTVLMARSILSFCQWQCDKDVSIKIASEAA